MTADSTAVVERIYMSCLDEPKKMGVMICEALIAAAEQVERERERKRAVCCVYLC
jgi:hypothetical protein